MSRIELLEEFSIVKDHIKGAIDAGQCIPTSYYREYNHLCGIIHGEKDPEIQEAENE